MVDFTQGERTTNEIIRSLNPMLEKLAEIVHSAAPTERDSAEDIELSRIATSLLEVHDGQWELETSCRAAEIRDPELGNLKRAIDDSNVRRISYINALDCATQHYKPDPGLSVIIWPLTIGQMIDQLLIAGLRVQKCSPPRLGAATAFSHVLRSFATVVGLMENRAVTLPPTSTIKVYLQHN